MPLDSIGPDGPSTNTSPGLSTRSGRLLVIVPSGVGALCIITTILRIIAQRLKKLRLGAHDYCILVATALIFPSTTLAIISGTSTDPFYQIKGGMALQCLYGICLAFIKTSMMVLYYLLFASKPSIHIALYVTGIIVWAWGFSNAVAVLSICSPFAYNWDKTITNGHCGNILTFLVVGGMFNIGTDLMILGLPIPYVWNLQIKIGRKIGLLSSFSLAIIATAISAFRIYSIIEPHTETSSLMWTVLELQIAIIAVNIPLCRPIAFLALPTTWLHSNPAEKYEMKPQTNLSRNTKELNIRARVRDSIIDDSILSWSPRENISSMRLTRPDEGEGTRWISDDNNSSGGDSSMDRGFRPGSRSSVEDELQIPPEAHTRADRRSFLHMAGDI